MGPTAATKMRPPVSRVPPEPAAHNPVALAAADLARIGPVDLAPMASLSTGLRLYEHGLNTVKPREVKAGKVKPGEVKAADPAIPLGCDGSDPGIPLGYDGPDPVPHNPVALAAADLAWIGPVDLAPMASLSSGMQLYEHGLNKSELYEHGLNKCDGSEPVPLMIGSAAGALWPKGEEHYRQASLNNIMAQPIWGRPHYESLEKDDGTRRCELRLLLVTVPEPDQWKPQSDRRVPQAMAQSRAVPGGTEALLQVPSVYFALPKADPESVHPFSQSSPSVSSKTPRFSSTVTSVTI